MPNVELFGFDWREAEDIREEIEELFCNSSVAGDMVVTVHHDSMVRNLSNQDQPFIRLTSTSGCPLEEITEKLQILGHDLEVFHLEAFYPAPEPVQEGRG